MYVDGSHFTVESEHKPFEIIHFKNLSTAPQRLQCLLLCILLYDLAIVYVSRKDMLLANALSRQWCENHVDTLDTDVFFSLVQFSANKLADLHQCTMIKNCSC